MVEFVSPRAIAPDESSEQPAALRKQPRTSWGPLLALVAIWTLEVFAVQHFTAIRTYYPLYFAARMGIRFALTLSSVVLVCLILPRLWLAAVVVGVALMESVVLTYAAYFHTSLSYFAIWGQWKEGLEVAEGGLVFLPKLAFLAVIAALGVKLFLVWWAYPLSWLRSKTRYVAAAGCLAFYVSGIYAVHARLDILRRSIVMYETGDVACVVGYLPAWFGEWYFSSNDSVFLDKAMAAAKESTDALTPDVPPLPPANLFVAVQLESVGFSCLHRQFGGKELTPFMNRLAQTSAVYRLRVMHRRGSADSDFAFLTGMVPNGLLMPYKVPGFPWNSSSWVRTLAEEKGYRTVWSTGFSKSFFAREMPLEKMGFETRYCREELGGPNPKSAFGLYTDREMYEKSLDYLRSRPKDRVFYFIISTTSHVPWTLEDPQQRILFENPSSDSENYFNSVCYADQCLRDYYEKLPEGTLLILFGDHQAFTDSEDRGESIGEEYSLCLIHVKGSEFGRLHKNREAAVAGRYTIVDLGAYVRNSIRQWPAPDSVEQNRGERRDEILAGKRGVRR